MKLYDNSIANMLAQLETAQVPVKSLDIESSSSNWEDIGDRNMILRGDMAYELGGGTFPALSGLAVTANEDFVDEDQVLLYGPDLSEIASDCGYARLALVRVDEESMGEGNDLYNAIRKIEYVRYHMNPKGYMMRISASNQREPARIGRDALAEGLDFAKVGKLFIERYHENPKIKAVKLIYITDPSFDFKALEKEIQVTEGITKTIDHIFKNVIMDCGSCSLQKVCDEVEGMKELHFGQQANRA